jgi:glycosyltransferase involved in cell wall biosynthesis
MSFMQILFVSPYFPIPQRSGGKVRVFHVLRELARTEQVTLVCYLSKESEPFVGEVERWGVEVRSIPREVRRRPLARHARFLATSIPFSLVDPDSRMQDLVCESWREKDYDVLQVEFLGMGYLARESMFEGRRFLTHHYSATDHYRRVLGIRSKRSPRYWSDLIESIKVPPYERDMLAQFSRVFVTSEQDRRLLSAVSPEASMVVANNGVDTDFYRSSRSEEASASRLLVSTCSFKTDTNIDSVVWFIDEVWPLIVQQEPEARYEVIGYDPPTVVREAAARSQGVTAVGGVDDVRPYMDRAVASLITMRAGSGTKIRALTSLAMGLPIVATPLGAEGLEAGEEDGILVGESPAALANLAARLLDVGVAQPMRQRARSYVERHHSWKKAVDTMKSTYEETLRR